MKIPKILFKDPNKQSGIYCIENTKNNKIYIGSSKNLYNRLSAHKCALNKNRHQNIKLQKSWNKHGSDNFICYVIEFCNPDILTTREQYYIDTLKPSYNITLDVIRNSLSEESRIKISKTLKEKYKSGEIKLTRFTPIDVYNTKGEYLNSYETIKSCSIELNVHESSIIRVLDKTHKQCKGFIFTYRGDLPDLSSGFSNYGRSLRKGKVFNSRSKKITILDLETGIYLEFLSMADMSKSLNINYSTVSHFIKRSICKVYKNRYKLIESP